jgi:hypothetical protein
MKELFLKSAVAALIKGARYLVVTYGGAQLWDGDTETKLVGGATVALGLLWSFAEDFYKAQQKKTPPTP